MITPTDCTLFIANRGEIAIRIAQTAAELGMKTIGIYAEDDAASLHTRMVDQAISLSGSGPQAYLDIDQIVALASQHNCQLLHPGYGFLSENHALARACEQVGIRFVGPRSNVLEQLGNKVAARQLAQDCQVPIIKGTMGATSLDEAMAFYEALPAGVAMMIKAKSGGGGRGMRLVQDRNQLEESYKRCQSEAEKAFGQSEMYVEQFISNARHIEIQVLGNGKGQVMAFGERDCSLQRRHQKIIEIAPCPDLPEELGKNLIQAAIQMAQKLNLSGLATFEFLVEGAPMHKASKWYFMEVNPRLQVEHTITEEVFGIDLVACQLLQACGKDFEEMDLNPDQPLKPRGYALQMRINMETIQSNGQLMAQAGTLKQYKFPAGRGIRIDGFGYIGYANNPRFDSLLAKIICHSQNYKALIKKCQRALEASHIEGIGTNIPLLQNIFSHPEMAQLQISTRWLDEQLKNLVSPGQYPKRFFETGGSMHSVEPKTDQLPDTEGLRVIRSPMPGTLLTCMVQIGQIVRKGQPLLIIEAMKMEILIQAEKAGLVSKIWVAEGAVLREGQALVGLDEQETADGLEDKLHEEGVDRIRADLEELQKRKAFLLDENRPDAIAKRRKNGQFTARENISSLCDPDTFEEYGGLAVAAQRKRRKLEDLIQNTPADGLVAGIGHINGQHFQVDRSRCMVLAYDFTVLAGTQGALNHKKMDRMLELADQWKLPVVLFAEGGGGRPGDVDFPVIAGLDVMTFSAFARLSGQAPRVAIVSRYCFAGNAALAGCADVLIATENVSIGMGGPAMIEGGGLGQFHPAQVGPAKFQAPNGVIDLLVKDEAAAIAAAKKYLSYFQGNLSDWECTNQEELRHIIPENRRRVYPIRKLIKVLADRDSVLELREAFAPGMITAFIRIEGRPLGLIANNPMHLGGAIDAQGADKAARFMQLCNAFAIPILTLCDTPGIMVGPEAEKQGTVRHTARLFVTGAALQVPIFTLVLRKGYGLGAMAMTGGSFHIPFLIAAWPTGEFGAMGLEGAVRLGFKKEIEQIEDPEARKAFYEKLVAKMYQRGKGINLASYLEIDDVIDPADSRRRIMAGLNAIPSVNLPPSNGKNFIDTW